MAKGHGAALAAAIVVLFLGAASAAETGRQGVEPITPVSRESPAETRADMVDRLFGRLVKATSREEAHTVEESIWKLWMTSDSPTAEVLLEQAAKASAAGENQAALDILNSLIAVHPEFTEAWNKRATVYFLMGRYQESLADIDKVLEREPRHFGALSGQGMIKQKLGDLSAARAAFSEALAVNPNLEGAKRALEEIDREER